MNLKFKYFRFCIADTICVLNLLWSVFGVCFINMIFKRQMEFIQRLRVLIIGQLFCLISDITFFVILKQNETSQSYSYDFFAFLLGLEMCYFVLMFELSLLSETLLGFQYQHSSVVVPPEASLPSYEEAVHMIEVRK